MGNSKVIFGNETLIDLTGDTVTPDTLLAGTTAHNRSGEQIVGTATVPDALDDLTDVELTSPAEGDLLQYDATEQKWVNSAKIPQKVAGFQATGCVNILPNEAISQVVSGATIVKNSDKSLSISTDANGTTADVNITIHTVAASEFETLSGKQWKLVGCPTGGGFSTYFLTVVRYNDGGSGAYDVGSGATFTFTRTVTSPAPYVLLTIKAGTVLTTPIIIKPMLTPDLSATYDDYKPYAMTNRELTEAVDSGSTTVSSSYTYAPLFFQKYGGVKQVNIQGLVNLPADTATVLCNLPDGYRILFDGKPTDFWVSNGVKIRIAFSKGSNNITARPYGTAISDSNIDLLITYI